MWYVWYVCVRARVCVCVLARAEFLTSKELRGCTRLHKIPPRRARMDCTDLLRTNVTPAERQHLEFLGGVDKNRSLEQLKGCRGLADYIRKGLEYSTEDVEGMFNRAFEPSGPCSEQAVMNNYHAVVEPRQKSIERARSDVCRVSEVLTLGANSEIKSMCD